MVDRGGVVVGAGKGNEEGSVRETGSWERASTKEREEIKEGGKGSR